MSLGLLEPGRVDWPTVKGICVQKGRHRLLHVHPQERAALAQAARAAGLSLYVVDRDVKSCVWPNAARERQAKRVKRR